MLKFIHMDINEHFFYFVIMDAPVYQFTGVRIRGPLFQVVIFQKEKPQPFSKRLGNNRYFLSFFSGFVLPPWIAFMYSA